MLESKGIIVKNWVEKKANHNSLVHEYINELPFSESLESYVFYFEDDSSDDYLEILNLYILSISKNASTSDKVSYLMSAFKKSRNMVAEGEHRIERLVTFSRIAIDAGERSFGIAILDKLINKYFTNINYEINELFLPASKRYDNIHPKMDINEWLFSSILDQFIEKGAFSLYFTKMATLPLFDRLTELGYISEDMRRRHQLVKDCFLR